MMPADFHFLRPEWLLALVPALLLAALAWRGMGKGRSDWQRVVDAHLLKHLAVKDEKGRRKWPVIVLLAAWALSALAVAGPTWVKVPAPALDRLDPTVVVLSLAQSMNATDQNPTRLVAARHKVEDILGRMKGGQVALVIYADAPFVASPLTEDGRVVASMLPELATDLMPVLADRPDLAIAKATELLKNTGAPSGRIILVTDGLGEAPSRTLQAASAAAAEGYNLNVIGVGTNAGSTLLAYDGSTLRGKDGNPVTVRMDAAQLTELAAAGHGRFTPVTADSRDLDTVLAKSLNAATSANPLQASGLTADQWVDMGSWLLVAVALMASLAFRRGWLATLPFALLLAGAPDAHAQTGFRDPAEGLAWGDMWQTPDQKGASAFQTEDYGTAAKSFQNPSWQASSLYKGGDFDSAANAFSRIPGADYNRGNALARGGKLEEAIKAYDAALAAKPDDADAAFNRDLVQKALDQQKKQDEQNKQNQDQKNQQNNQNQQSQNQQKPDDKQGDQNKPDPQKQGDQKDKDQKPGDQKKDDPKQAGQNPPQQQQQQQPQQQQPQQQGNDQKKPDPSKPDPNKQDQQNKSAGNQPPAPQPQPQQQPQPQGQQPPQAPPKQADAPPPPQQAKQADTPPPPTPPQGAVAIKPMTEQDQNREQALRMVPDDPTGLLRARIRSHYAGTVVPAVEDNP